MRLETILLIVSTIVAPVIAVFVTYFVTKEKNKWKRVKSSHIPLWVIHFLYNEVFPDRICLADGSRVFLGTYFQYKVVFKRRIAEPDAQIKDLVIYRKVRDDKY